MARIIANLIDGIGIVCFTHTNMATQKRFTDLEIASKLRAGKAFTVDNFSQRNRVYTIANALEKKITIRPDDFKFKVSFI